jgi:hypothetical protein
MANFPFKARNSNLVRNYYLMHNQMLEPYTSASCAVEEMEDRITEHLDQLARLGEPCGAPDGDDAERFLFYATTLQSAEPETLEEIVRLAFAQMDDANLTNLPIYHAFTLYPPPLEGMLALYHALPAARTPLFALWDRQRADLPERLVDQAEQQREDPTLQCQALGYAADHPAYGVERFRPYYEPLLDPAGRPPRYELLLEPALWGGLVRGDPEASVALRRAVERVQTPQMQPRLLRLLALNGAPEDLALLLSACERAPLFDLRWLGLTGRQEAVAPLIDRLGRATTAASANDAWMLLFGESLRLDPVLALVGEPGEPSPERDGPQPMIASRQQAQDMWEYRRASWGKRRWLMGRPDDPDWQYEHCRLWAGAISIDLMDRLSLKHQRPLGPWHLYGWRSHQLRQLETALQGMEPPQDPNETESTH